MKSYNLIALFDEKQENVLMCLRQKPPFLGKYNLPGGKIEPGEESLHAACRELEEETGVARQDTTLRLLMEMKYYDQEWHLEVYTGRLRHPVALREEAHPLRWVSLSEDFFDESRFAGDGNLGIILRQALKYRDRLI